MSAWHKMSDREHRLAREWKLAPGEARIFFALHDAAGCCPHQDVHSDFNTRKVLISNLRRKAVGFEIRNMYGRGYLLKAKIKPLMAAGCDEDRRAGV